jgi:hypothetical protein
MDKVVEAIAGECSGPNPCVNELDLVHLRPYVKTFFVCSRALGRRVNPLIHPLGGREEHGVKGCADIATAPITIWLNMLRW